MDPDIFGGPLEHEAELGTARAAALFFATGGAVPRVGCVRVEMPTSRVVQIVVTPGTSARWWIFWRQLLAPRCYYLLCEDGSAWERRGSDTMTPWSCLHPAPVSPSVVTTTESLGAAPWIPGLHPNVESASAHASPKPVRRSPAKAAGAPQAKSPSRSVKTRKAT